MSFGTGENNGNHYKQFEKEFSREIHLNEKIRSFILGIAFLAMFIVFVIVTLFYYDKLLAALKSFTPIYIAMALLLAFSVRAFLISRYFESRLKKQAGVREFQRYINVFAEISMPTITMLVILFYANTHVVLLTPMPYVYFIMIILTTLSLDFRLSVFTGIVASIEYLILVFYVLLNQNHTGDMNVLSQPYIYIGKGGILLMSGVLAGYVALQLKKRIFTSYEIISERNRVVNLFGQQVSREIVDELIANKQEFESKRKFVCVMFLDIRGFTPLVEHKEPEEIIDYQNSVFGFMIDIITRNHGIINQFLGDGYMATFGVPLSKGNDCQNAVNAALEIINTITIKNTKEEILKTGIGIGLHAGYVVAGNVGTSTRKQYSITGNTVIIASRIESLNKIFKSTLLISQEVLDQIDTSNLAAESLGEVEVKGREKPVNIYKLV